MNFMSQLQKKSSVTSQIIPLSTGMFSRTCQREMEAETDNEGVMLKRQVRMPNYADLVRNDPSHGKVQVQPKEIFATEKSRYPLVQRQAENNPDENTQLLAESSSKSFWMVSSPSSPGWVDVKPSYLFFKGGEASELPHNLEMKEESIVGSVMTATINQGRYRGKDIKIETSKLIRSHVLAGSASVKFDIAKSELWYGGNGPVKTITHPTTPTPRGKYDLQIPDFQHHGGAKYGDFGTTWFRIGSSGDRYLHPGNGSLGCTTVREHSEWPSIWRYLISSRKDNYSVGEIEII